MPKKIVKIYDNVKILLKNYYYFHINDASFSGTDSISLINFIKGYPDESFSQTVKDLSSYFDDYMLTNSLALFLYENEEYLNNLVAQPFNGPIMSEEEYPHMKDILCSLYDFNPGAIDIFNKANIIGADRTGNVILCSNKPYKTKTREWKKTYFRMDYGQKELFINLEEEKIPFFLPGEDILISVMRYPIDALKVKYSNWYLSIMVFSYDWSRMHLDFMQLFLKVRTFNFMIESEENSDGLSAENDFALKLMSFLRPAVKSLPATFPIDPPEGPQG
jgi:hypothetical protein